jgi:Ca2+-binding RTX toxin-like protein
MLTLNIDRNKHFNTKSLNYGIVFIDSAVEDYQTLMAGVVAGNEVVLLDSKRDGLEQISEILAKHNNLDSIHIVSHGSPGCVKLGTGELNLARLDRDRYLIQDWKDSLTDSGEILIYSCNVAAENIGKTFVEKLGKLTGANISASSTLTGNAALGGNWQLDVQTAKIQSSLAFAPEVMASYAFVLPDIFYDPFASNSSGWTLGNEWQIGSATASNGHVYGNPDPSVDNTPTSDNGVAGVAIGGNASTQSLHDYYYLTSPVINTNVAGDVFFEYSRWLNSDYTPYMQNTIEIFNGSSWVPLYTTGSSPGVQDTTWGQQSFDITAYKNADTQIRFGFKIGNGGVYTVSSWNIDDFKVYSNQIPTLANTIKTGDDYNVIKFSASDFTDNFNDLDSDSLSKIKITSLPSDGKLKLGSQAVTVNQEINVSELNNLLFVPSLGFGGTVNFDWNGFDGASYADDDATVNLTLTPINHSPSAIVAKLTASEDVPFIYEVDINTFDDINTGDNLNYSATLDNGEPLPEWLSFDAATLAFSGTPSNDDVSNLRIRLTATDLSGATANGIIKLAVANTNDAPFVADEPTNQTAFEDSAFSFQMPIDAFADVDANDSLSYSATLEDGEPLPEWLSFDAATLSFSGTPTNKNVGNIAVKVIATDVAGEMAQTTFNLETINTNDAPTVANSIANQTATEDNLFSFQMPSNIFNDVDANDFLNYSATLENGEPLPEWLSFDAATLSFSGTPTNNNVGNIAVKIIATDYFGEMAQTTFNLETINTNDAPTVANSIANQTATEDSLFSFQMPSNIFNDVDANDFLNYSATLENGEPLPEWLSFDAATLSFSGTPTNNNVGNIAVKVIATDAAGEMAEAMFDVAIVDIQNGTGNPETFNVTPNIDSISAAGGNDTVNATLANLQQKDTIDGGNDTDTLTLTAGDPSDTISLDLNNPSNQLQSIPSTSLTNFEVFNFGSFAGTTNFLGGSGNDSMQSGEGLDTLVGGVGSDTFRGGNGDDLVEGGEGIDYLGGNAGSDTLDGGNGNDKYFFEVDNDTIVEAVNGGVDTVNLYVSNSALANNVENLILKGSASASLNGTGNDLSNILTGNPGHNLLSGLGGNDTLDGGAKNDTLTGGTGNDRFVYNTDLAFAASDIGIDLITDFVATADKIVLDKTTFASLTSSAGNGFNIGSEFAVVANNTNVASSAAKIVYSSGTGNLFYNENGSATGLGAGSQFAIFTGSSILTANDFVIQN